MINDDQTAETNDATVGYETSTHSLKLNSSNSYNSEVVSYVSNIRKIRKSLPQLNLRKGTKVWKQIHDARQKAKKEAKRISSESAGKLIADGCDILLKQHDDEPGKKCKKEKRLRKERRKKKGERTLNEKNKEAGFSSTSAALSDAAIDGDGTAAHDDGADESVAMSNIIEPTRRERKRKLEVCKEESLKKKLKRAGSSCSEYAGDFKEKEKKKSGALDILQNNSNFLVSCSPPPINGFTSSCNNVCESVEESSLTHLDDEDFEPRGKKKGKSKFKKTKRRKKKKERLSGSLLREGSILKEVSVMAALLKNEIQQPYDPRVCIDRIDQVERRPDDHLNRQIKQGTYTTEEDEILSVKINDYFNKQGWEHQRGWNELRPKSKAQSFAAAEHWCKIATCLPQRSVRSVRQHVQKSLVPWKTGAWTKAEEAELVEHVRLNGTTWAEMSKLYFRRNLDCVYIKWKELEPFVSPDGTIIKPRKEFTENDDVRLLTSIRMVTGVTLPHRSIPWSLVQREMSDFSKKQLAQRYKYTLFPAVLGTFYKGATILVVLRQFLRYVKSGMEAGVLQDLRDVDMRRVVPFWYTMNYRKTFTRFLKLACPEEIRKAPLKDQILFSYDLLKCEQKEKNDLRRLAKSFKVLMELNGVSLIGYRRGVLSERFERQQQNRRSNAAVHEPVVSKFESELFKKEVVSPDLISSKVSHRGFCALNIFGGLDVCSDFMLAAAEIENNHNSRDGAAQDDPSKVTTKAKPSGKSIEVFVPPTEQERTSMKIPLPLHASVEKIKAVVPRNLQAVPDAFPIYLSAADRYRRGNLPSRTSGEAIESATEYNVNSLDRTLYESLGLLDEDVTEGIKKQEITQQQVGTPTPVVDASKGRTKTRVNQPSLIDASETRGLNNEGFVTNLLYDNGDDGANDADDNDDYDDDDQNHELHSHGPINHQDSRNSGSSKANALDRSSDDCITISNEYWDAIEKVSNFANEATDSDSDSTLLSAILTKTDDNKSKKEKCILVNGVKLSKKHHPWMC